MNFFEHQDSARKKTSLLVFLLVAAVLCLIAVTVVAVGLLLYFLGTGTTSITAYQAQQLPLSEHFLQLLGSPLIGWIALSVIVVVAAGSFYKLLRLGGGGRSVAESLGAKQLDPDSREHNERKILNIVEEMAIASGNPVPPVYVIEEEAINAFAAGLNRRDAVIGVTRGCINHLERDELQGVVAHEFSHIHNGDMRLNMRIIAVLHGILLIGLIGYYITRGSGTGFSRSRRDGRQVAVGLVLIAVGYGGTFFGNIIKAAVSRQREFLADASAVQFTRNPAGISGALKKIGGYSAGSLLTNGKASEYSHLYFGQGIKTAFSGLMATHPPLGERIKRIDPDWHGEFSTDIASNQLADTAIAGFAPESGTSAERILNTVCQPNETSIAEADRLITGLPESLREAAHQAFSARALLYALVLGTDKQLRSRQLAVLKKEAHPVTYRELLQLQEKIKPLDREMRHSLRQLCMPALKSQSERQFQVFKKNLISLIRADGKVSVYEWCVYRSTVKTLKPRALNENLGLTTLKSEVVTLLAFIIRAGSNKNADSLIAQTVSKLGIDMHEDSVKAEVSLTTLDQAIDKLERLKPLEKPKLLKALLDVIKADGKILSEEREIFRAVADTLNCPVPPIAHSTTS